MRKPTKTEFRRMVAAATKAAGYGRGYRKELTLWPARTTWPDPGCPGEGAVNEGADMLGFTPDEVYARWDGRQVIEVYVSTRVGPAGYDETELIDNVEIDPVTMEWYCTGPAYMMDTSWHPLEAGR